MQSGAFDRGDANPGFHPGYDAYVALGANLGDPPAQLNAAVQAIKALPHTVVTKLSAYYRSKAIGPADQPDYCNAVAQLETTLEPLQLLAALQHIETQAGRARGEHWGARVLDLDLLLHGQTVCHTQRLTLPHPHLTQRDFVLVPLAEIAPDAAVPMQGSAKALLAKLPQQTLAVWA